MLRRARFHSPRGRISLTWAHDFHPHISQSSILQGQAQISPSQQHTPSYQLLLSSAYFFAQISIPVPTETKFASSHLPLDTKETTWALASTFCNQLPLWHFSAVQEPRLVPGCISGVLENEPQRGLPSPVQRPHLLALALPAPSTSAALYCKVATCRAQPGAASLRPAGPGRASRSPVFLVCFTICHLALRVVSY